MSGQYNSVSDYLRSISEMWNGDDTSYYRSLNGQIMFPEPGSPPPEPQAPRPAETQ